MLKRVLFSLIALLIVGSSLTAQEPQKPGEEHKKLYELVGTWDCVMKMPGAEDSKGVAVYRRTLDGMWVQTDFEGEYGGEKFHGKGFDSYDAGKKKYVSVWLDSTTGSPSVFEGNYDADGKTMTMLSHSTAPDGTAMTLKSVTTHADAGHMTFTMYVVAEDKTESEMMSIAYTRRKDDGTKKSDRVPKAVSDKKQAP